MEHKPLGRIPKNRKRPATQMEGTYVKQNDITISMEEYTHLKQCESFIDDNGHFWTFEAYKDVVAHNEKVEQAVAELHNEIEIESQVIEQNPEDPTRV